MMVGRGEELPPRISSTSELAEALGAEGRVPSTAVAEEGGRASRASRAHGEGSRGGRGLMSMGARGSGTGVCTRALAAGTESSRTISPSPEPKQH